MTVISDLSPSYAPEISATEMLAVVGGTSYSHSHSFSYSSKKAKVNIVQVVIGGYCCSPAINYSDVCISQS
jgi:hypothetical protein